MKNRWLPVFILVLLMLILTLLHYDSSVATFSSLEGHSRSGLCLVINEVTPENRSIIADDDGNFEDWIELYNYGNTEIDLAGFGLTDKTDQPFLWTFPRMTIKPGSYLLIWASGKDKKEGIALHTNFKLNQKEETVILSNAEGTVVDTVYIYNVPTDISLGKTTNNKQTAMFSKPTPSDINNSEIYEQPPLKPVIGQPEFSHLSGFYTDAFDLILISPDKDAVIYYTLDGSEPGKDSEIYEGPIRIKSRVGEANQYSAISPISIYESPPQKEVFKATVIRAKAFKGEEACSETVTHTYFIDKDMASRYKLPIISLVTDPANLFDHETGIYVKGKVFDEWKKKNPRAYVQGDTPANYNQRGREWERPAAISFFEQDGKLGFVQNVGIRTSGGWTRANRHKSLRVIARDEYDAKDTIHYDLFPGLMKRGNPNQPVKSFKRILFRSSGNDWEFTMFRDAFMQSLIWDTGLDLQAYRPAVMFVNGEFWGIHNIRETFDEYYLENHYGLDKDDSIILEGASYQNEMALYYGKSGDEDSFHELIEFVRNHDMSLPENYDQIKTLIDVENFIQYSAAQIYFDNTDWPGNNIKVWRKRTAYEPDAPYGHDGRWRWMLYDTDFGYGLYSQGRTYKHNTLEFATTPHGEPWPNPDWSTVLLRRLLTNEAFKNQFVTCMADFLNSRFDPDYVAQRINEMSKVIEPAMQEHLERWMINEQKMSGWRSQINNLVLFAQNRVSYITRDIIKYFNISRKVRLELAVSDRSRGTIQINAINPDFSDGPWTGTYFGGIPITLKAIPNKGYTFTGWEGVSVNNSEPVITITADQDIKLIANFE